MKSKSTFSFNLWKPLAKLIIIGMKEAWKRKANIIPIIKE